MPLTPAGPPPSIEPRSPARRRLVEAAQARWIKQLIDLSRRNTLLYFRPWKLATAELQDWDPGTLNRLLSGESVTLVDLLPEERDLARRSDAVEADATVYTEEGAEDVPDDERTGLPAKLQAIGRKAQENFEERGMETMYLAYGMATWKSDDGGRDPEAAVLLLPVAVEGVGRKRAVVPRGDLETNLALLYQLERLGCEDLTDDLDDLIDDPPSLVTGEAQEQVLDELKQAAHHVPGFQIHYRVVIGNFSFEKLAMVKDLQANLEALVRSDLVAALAGDVEAGANLRQAWEESQIDPTELDKLPASSEYLVASADSSQQAAIVMVGRGQSGVISGPPGTGKSQTITNLIASLIADGKSVLFVAQKRAALEVVKRRLEMVGLQHLVLDLHGTTKKAEVMRQFAQSYELIRHSLPIDSAALDANFEHSRAWANDHVMRLHWKRAPSGLSVYDLQSLLLGADPGSATTVRWSGQELKDLKSERVRQLEGLLSEASGLEDLFLRDEDSAWAGAGLVGSAEVSKVLAALSSLINSQLQELRRASGAYGATTGMPTSTLNAVREARRLGQAAQDIFATYQPGIFNLDLERIAAVMGPAGSGLTRLWFSTFDSAYRSARNQVRALRRAPAPDATLLGEVKQAVALRRDWQSLNRAGSSPAPTPSFTALTAALDQFEASWRPVRELLAWGDVDNSTLDDLTAWLEELEAQRDDAFRLPRLWEIENTLSGAGLAPLIEDIRTRRPARETWIDILRYAYHQSCLQAAWLEDPTLAAFDGHHHNKIIETFRSLDRQRTEAAAQRVRRAFAQKAIAVRDAHPDQEAMVREQAKRKTRHKPVRTLIKEAPDVVTALRPCWMASPLAVSQLLAGDARYFDVVIFDEASQVLPEDAVTSILRGQTIVVAGDEKQLPPTPFFASGVDETELSREEAEPVEGYESVLEIMGKVFDPWDLTWHYRSQDERLIAFSNRHIYDDRLITFPGVGLVEPVRFIEVRQVAGQDGQEDSSSPEVERVADLILEHAKERPRESLGVIAMGIKHAYRIEAQLAKRRLQHPELDEFFSNVEHQDERFFVKNLERVQGDERDAIILSIGYGKNRAGTLGLNFGPLTNTKMGHRRLNVAVTRAKRRVTAVASFNAGDMDPKRLNALGMKLVREYLEYAAAGGNQLGDAGGQPVALNGFEESVRKALEGKGISLIPQYGAGFYRLDFAVQHPRRKGRFVMAVECDGATYHSANTARDRDRLRQEHLELLGWKFCRIWSTDWYRHREAEIKRVIAAYEEAVRAADAEGDRSAHARPQLVEPPPPPSGQVVQLPSQPVGGPRRLGRPITEYSRQELLALKAGIEGDGQLRTKDELIREMSDRLGYDRLGSRIRARLAAIIEGRDVSQQRPTSRRPAYRSYRRRY